MFSIGTRFNDRVTGKLSEFAPNAKIIHIDIDSASISRNIVVDIPIVGDAKLAIEEMIPLAKKYNTHEWLEKIYFRKLLKFYCRLWLKVPFYRKQLLIMKMRRLTLHMFF